MLKNFVCFQTVIFFYDKSLQKHRVATLYLSVRIINHYNLLISSRVINRSRSWWPYIMMLLYMFVTLHFNRVLGMPGTS